MAAATRATQAPDTVNKRSKPAAQIADLTPQQEQAAAMIAEGRPVSEVSEALGVSGTTVASWQAAAVFVAEVNRTRQATWTAAQDRLRALVPAAVETLEAAVQGGDTRAAVEILKAAGVYGQLRAPSGPVDPAGVEVEQAEAWAEAQLKHEGPGGMIAMIQHSERKEDLTRERLRELRGETG